MAATYNGAFGPGVPIGWANRLMVVAYAGWVVATAHQAEPVS